MLKTKNVGLITKCDAETAFVKIPNEICQSNTISPISKTILIYLLSLPSDWSIVKTTMHNKLGVGKYQFDNGWKELIDLGYIIVKRQVDNITKTIYYNYSVDNQPHIEKPSMAFKTQLIDNQPHIEKPSMAFKTQLIDNQPHIGEPCTGEPLTENHAVYKDILQKNIKKEKTYVNNTCKEIFQNSDSFNRGKNIHVKTFIEDDTTSKLKLLNTFVSNLTKEDLIDYKFYMETTTDFYGLKNDIINKLSEALK